MLKEKGNVLLGSPEDINQCDTGLGPSLIGKHLEKWHH